MSYNNIMAKSLGSSKSSLVFKVTRQAPELIRPAGATPYELKELSDIDDQDFLRFHIPVIQFYRHSRGKEKDPARVIKEAVAKALVSYYPFAGRLREKQGRKLVVECNRKGVIFIEADADVTLEAFGDQLHPPFPCFQELLYHVPGSTHLLDTPLILIQVTRLKCGGFILALRLNHTMADAQGLVQFMSAVAELARGADSPSIYPVWERHLLCARDPPRVTCQHHAYDEVADTKGTLFPLHDMAQKSFFFGPTEITALRRFIPPNMKASTFEILTACLWRCRTIALQPDPNEIFRISCVVNTRSHAYVPKGYYGNSFAISASISTAKQLSSNPISYVLRTC
ncbi:Benzyl alcohol O-benzoyltransferase [Bienertia sinuspersici]